MNTNINPNRELVRGRNCDGDVAQK